MNIYKGNGGKVHVFSPTVYSLHNWQDMSLSLSLKKIHLFIIAVLDAVQTSNMLSHFFLLVPTDQKTAWAPELVLTR